MKERFFKTISTSCNKELDMKKVMSFSVWGTDPKYTVGAVRNAEQLQNYYPGWIGKFYVDATVPRGIIYQLEDCSNTIVVELDRDWETIL